MAKPKSAKPRPAKSGTALVTGASSGIGEALARELARRGFDLVLVARRADKLQALAESLAADGGVRTMALPCDLTQPDTAAALAASLDTARVEIDLLVNNAGVLFHGPFARQPPAQHRALVELNVLGLTQMLAQFVPPMVARGRGRVLNVASIAAFQPVPMLATYAATKAFVLSITESLAEELKDSGVTVTALCPGITDTPMLSAAQRASRELQQLPGVLVGSAEPVAREGVDACLAGEVIRVPGALNQLTTVAGRALPRWLVRRLSGALTRNLK